MDGMDIKYYIIDSNILDACIITRDDKKYLMVMEYCFVTIQLFDITDEDNIEPIMQGVAASIYRGALACGCGLACSILHGIAGSNGKDLLDNICTSAMFEDSRWLIPHLGSEKPLVEWAIKVLKVIRGEMDASEIVFTDNSEGSGE